MLLRRSLDETVDKAAADSCDSACSSKMWRRISWRGSSRLKRESQLRDSVEKFNWESQLRSALMLVVGHMDVQWIQLELYQNDRFALAATFRRIKLLRRSFFVASRCWVRTVGFKLRGPSQSLPVRGAFQSTVTVAHTAKLSMNFGVL